MAGKGDAAGKAWYGFRLVGHSPLDGLVFGANHEWDGGLGLRYPIDLYRRSLAFCRIFAANILGNKNTIADTVRWTFMKKCRQKVQLNLQQRLHHLQPNGYCIRNIVRNKLPMPVS